MLFGFTLDIFQCYKNERNKAVSMDNVGMKNNLLAGPY